MRCNEAKKLLTEKPLGSNPDLAAHLEVCTTCREVARESAEVEALLASAREDLPVVALGAMRRCLEERSAGQSRWEIMMSNLTDRTREHHRMVAGIGLALAVFLLVTLVPFSYTSVTGYRITLSGEPRPELSTRLMTAAMTAAGHQEVTVIEGVAPGQYVFSGLASRQEAENIAAALVALTGSEQAPSVEPVLEKMSGTIYAQAARKIVGDDEGPVRIRLEDGRFVLRDSTLRVALSSAGTADADIENMIREYMNNQGAQDHDFIISAEMDEDRMVRIIRLRESESGESSGQGEQIYRFRGNVAIRYQRADSAGASYDIIDVFADGDFDSIADELRRGLILEVPGDSRSGEEPVMIRLHVVPRDKPDAEK